MFMFNFLEYSKKKTSKKQATSQSKNIVTQFSKIALYLQYRKTLFKYWKLNNFAEKFSFWIN